MKVTFLVGLGLGVAGCAAPEAIPEGLMHPFACPAAGTRTVIEQAGGTRYATVWLGAEPGDPDMCLSENGSGKNKRARMFGRWNLADDVGGTREEQEGARRAVGDLLAGRSRSAGFILRGRTGEQTSERWVVLGPDDQAIGGRTVRAVHIRITYTYAGNGYSFVNNVWFAPDEELFVRSEASADLPRRFVWRMVKITAPREKTGGLPPAASE